MAMNRASDYAPTWGLPLMMMMMMMKCKNICKQQQPNI